MFIYIYIYIYNALYNPLKTFLSVSVSGKQNNGYVDLPIHKTPRRFVFAKFFQPHVVCHGIPEGKSRTYSRTYIPYRLLLLLYIRAREGATRTASPRLKATRVIKLFPRANRIGIRRQLLRLAPKCFSGHKIRN